MRNALNFNPNVQPKTIFSYIVFGPTQPRRPKPNSTKTETAYISLTNKIANQYFYINL